MSVNKLMAVFVAAGGAAVSYMLVKAVMENVKKFRETSFTNSMQDTWKKTGVILVILLYVMGLLLFGGVTLFSLATVFGFEKELASVLPYKKVSKNEYRLLF